MPYETMGAGTVTWLSAVCFMSPRLDAHKTCKVDGCICECHDYGRKPEPEPTFDWNGEAQPTFVIRVSFKRDEDDVERFALALTHKLTTINQGADVSRGLGIWEGQVEDSFTITMQGTEQALDLVMRMLADMPWIRWVHVEKHTPRVAYFDLDTLR